MAFKMKGFNPGQGTGMASAFLKDDKFVANNPNKVNPEDYVDGKKVQPETLTKDVPVKPVAETKSKSKIRTKIDDARVKRKNRKAEKLRLRAAELKEKGGKDKKVARLEKRADNKNKRADFKEKQAENIAADKPKKSNITDDRTSMQVIRGGKDKVYTESGKSKDATKVPVKKEPVKKEATFGESFKAARKSGAKEFTYKGKKYHTRQKEEDKGYVKKGKGEQGPQTKAGEEYDDTRVTPLKKKKKY